MSRALAISLCLVLCGCVRDRMNDGLHDLVGQNIQSAVSRLGYPDGEREMLGAKIYVWSSSHNVALPFTTTGTTTGMVGGTPFYGTSTGMSFVPANFNCTIQLAADKDGTITNYQWSGNMGGCEPYSKALTR